MKIPSLFEIQEAAQGGWVPEALRGHTAAVLYFPLADSVFLSPDSLSRSFVPLEKTFIRHCGR